MRTSGGWRTVSKTFFAVSVAVSSVVLSPAARADLTEVQEHLTTPAAAARPMVRWWWFGPAVTEGEIRREIEAMKAGGFGGFELQNTYPLQTEGNLKFLSPEHLKMIGVAAAEAKQQGLRMDLTLGSGWPYGGPGVPIEAAAGRLRVEKGANPKLDAGETLIGTYPSKDGGSVSYISSRTRMKVKRPAFGAEGWVVDHLDSKSLGGFLDVVAKPMLDACGDAKPYAVFCDSLECYGEDWTPRLLEEFRKRRGYDLAPLLPKMLEESDAAAAELRHDWGQTVTELFDEQFMKPLGEFAHERGTRVRIQAYGTPAAGLKSYLLSDLPEGEGWQWRGYRATRYASSAAHLMGVPVASSETFTWIHPPVFRATPLDIKAEAHLHFLQGVNQIICHGWPYTPSEVKDPGASFYVGGVFNDHNPWWGVMSDLNTYLTRCCDLLRQGEPANEVLVYLANDDAWARFKPGRASLTDGVGDLLKSSSGGRSPTVGPNLVNSLIDAGYGIDFVDDGMLAGRGKVEGGTLVFGKVKYKAIVLAGVERLPARTMETLEAFAKGGGTLLATRSLPSRAPGYLATEQDHQAVKAWSERVLGGKYLQADTDVAQALKEKLLPDVEFGAPTPAVGFIHRRLDGGDVYFLANTSNRPLALSAKFKAAGRAEAWNLMTGERRTLAMKDGAAALQFEPYESTVVAFSSGAGSAASVMTDGQHTETDLSSGWSVQFPSDAAPRPLEGLKSWTDDPATERFSGVAAYTRTITVEPKPSERVILSLGKPTPLGDGATGGSGAGFVAGLEPPVGEAAVVFVNGQRAGSVWSPPYELEITRWLKPGGNDIRIDVANTAVNALAAAGFPNYDDRELVKTYGKRFDAPRADAFAPAKSGLTGPITLKVRNEAK